MSQIIELHKCKLIDIVNPGQYLLLSLDEEHVSVVRHLEESLAKEVICFENQSNMTLLPDMDIIVKPPDRSNIFKRGRIKGKLNENNYSVFLIDYGEVVTINESRIILVQNKLFHVIEPLSFTLQLHGLLPITTFTVDNDFKQQICKEWSLESRGYIEGLFSRQSEFMVESILICGNAVYGDILISQNVQSSNISLRKLLVEREYCVYSELRFLKTVFGINNASWPIKHHEKVTANKDGNFLPKKIVGTKNEAPIQYEENDWKENVVTSELTEGRSITEIRGKAINDERLLSDRFREVSIGRGKKLILPSGNCEHKNAAKGYAVTIDDSDETYPETNVTKRKEEKTPVEKKSQRFASRKWDFSLNMSHKDETYSCEKLNLLNDFEDLDDILLIENPLYRTNKHLSRGEDQSKDLSSVKNKVEILERNFQGTRNLKNGYGEPFVLFKNSDSVEPVYTFKNLKIEPHLKQSLYKLSHFEDLNLMQRWSLPAILSGQNVVVIGSSKTGKTLSYIISIINLIERKLAFKLPPGNGPLAIILCPSSHVCESIYRTCSCLLKNNVDCQKKNSKLSIVVAYGSTCENKLWVKLTNGCHLLISTPHCLNRLLERPIVTNLERLSYLVLDEFNILAEEPFKSKICRILENRRLIAKSQNYQMILCGASWTPPVEALLKRHVESYVLILSSYMEAAIYARLKPKIYFSDQDHKREIVCDEINKMLGEKKILVACENSIEAYNISKYLKDKNLNLIMADECVKAVRHSEILLDWNVFRPLIATDAILHELNIKDADVLIHYTMTKKSKTNFFFRYATILNGYFSADSNIFGQNKRPPVDLILLDESNHYQLPEIVEYVNRLGGNVPPRLFQISQKIRRQIETSKESRLCQELLSLGCCRKRSCPQRHAFLRSLDFSSLTHPSQGWVSFFVVKVHDASRFSVQLLQHIDLNGVKSTVNHCHEVSDKVKTFYEIELNRRSLSSPKIGHYCAVKSRRSFDRGEIIECLRRNDHDQPTEFIVRLIDKGDFVHAKKCEIFELPSDLAEIPPLTIDVVLLGIRPIDFDTNWSREATAYTASLLMQKLEENQNWFGKIVFALRNVLFLEPVMLKRYLAGVNAYVYDLILGEKILKGRFAVPNKNHLNTLIRLCKENDVEWGVEKEELEFPVNPPWTILDQEMIPVNVSVVESISSIFVQMKGSENLVAEIKRHCLREAEKCVIPSSLTSQKQQKLFSGMFCLAPFMNSWRRGKIESETEHEFEIYFVDHGNLLFVRKEDVFPILNKDLLRLPCQAIECRLMGIREFDEEAESELLSEMCEFLFAEPWIYAQVCGEDVEKGRAGGPKYCLNLINSKNESLSKHLLSKKMVEIMDCGGKYLDEGNISSAKNGNDKETNTSNLNEEIDENRVCNEKNLKKYFDSLTDDNFTNENEFLFLEEFASKIFTKISTEVKAEAKSGEPRKKSTPPTSHYRRIMHLHRNPNWKVKEMPKLQIRSDVYTPQVFWRQDRASIRMKVVLNNVNWYRCDCTVTNVLFRCLIDYKLYAVDLKFFGGINPKTVRIHPQAFQINITMNKLCPWMWPRLHRDEGKHCWIHSDLDGLHQSEENFILNVVETGAETVKRNMQAGIFKGAERTEKLLPYGESEEEDEEEEEEENEEEDEED